MDTGTIQLLRKEPPDQKELIVCLPDSFGNALLHISSHQAGTRTRLFPVQTHFSRPRKCLAACRLHVVSKA